MLGSERGAMWGSARGFMLDSARGAMWGSDQMFAKLALRRLRQARPAKETSPKKFIWDLQKLLKQGFNLKQVQGGSFCRLF